jgi:hypothetical protein
MHAPMHHVIGMHAHLVIFACPQQNRNKKVLGGGGEDATHNGGPLEFVSIETYIVLS